MKFCFMLLLLPTLLRASEISNHSNNEHEEFRSLKSLKVLNFSTKQENNISYNQQSYSFDEANYTHIINNFHKAQCYSYFLECQLTTNRYEIKNMVRLAKKYVSEKNWNQAIRWYIQAGDNGYIGAWNTIGLICFNELSDTRNALYYFKKGAFAGCPKAKINYTSTDKILRKNRKKFHEPKIKNNTDSKLSK